MWNPAPQNANLSSPPGSPGAPAGPPPAGAPGDRLAPFYRRIVEEIRSGFKNEVKSRLNAAQINDDYYHERWDAYTSPWRLDPKAIRCLPILREAAWHLTAHLYRNAPARTFPEFDGATQWLQQIYRRNAMDAKWQDADKLAVVNQVASFQVEGELGPRANERPVKITLWGGESLMVWLDPDDALTPIAVATLDKFDEQRRVRLWTPDHRYTFLTAKWHNQTAGATAYHLTATEENPYRDAEGVGILPFSFVHFNFPTVYFWSGGPGDGLRKANEHINYRLSKLADDILHWRLIGIVTGARADWNFPKDLKAGEFTVIPAGLIDAAGQGIAPDVKYLAPDLSHVPGDWDDLNRYLELQLQLHHIPPAAFRLEQTASQSGIALVAEQIPLIAWATSRQRPFGSYEADLARLTCKIGAAHARNNDVGDMLGVKVDEIEAAASETDLALRWGEMSEELPGPTRDQSDQSQYNNYTMSRTLWVMKRKNMTREEAEAYIVEVADDLQREQELFGPIQQAAMGGLGAAPTDEETETDGGPESEPGAEPGTEDAEPEDAEPDDE